MEKNNNNIINIYKLYVSEKETSYIYSIKNNTTPTSYSYFMLTSNNDAPQIKRIQNAIKFLQMANLNIKKVEKDNKDYEEFVALFASLIANKPPASPLTPYSTRQSYLRFIPKRKK